MHVHDGTTSELNPPAEAPFTEQLIAEAVARHNVTTVFGVVGEGSLAIVDALIHRHQIRYVPTAREDGAILMADGYARVSGTVGVAAITHGPALTNTVTALTEAAPESVNLNEAPSSGIY